MVRIFMVCFFFLSSFSFSADSKMDHVTKVAIRKVLDQEGYDISDQKIQILINHGVNNLYDDKKDKKDLEFLLERIRHKQECVMQVWKEERAPYLYSGFIISLCLPWALSLVYLPDEWTILGLPFSISASYAFHYFYKPAPSVLDTLIKDCESILRQME